jgi:GTP:adenosylcobinamide-phosphate guanylyltransferase
MSSSSDTEAHGAWTALVLSAGRPNDPLALAEGVPNKTLIDLCGKPVLQRVIDALHAAPSTSRIVVAIEDASLLDAITPRPEAARAAESVVATVTSGLEQLGPPLLIVTGDHGLLTADMVEEFLAGVLEKGASASVGLASEAVIQGAYPDVRRTYLKFAEGGFSGCNLFALARPDAADALGFWQEIDRNRKNPLKLIRSVDIKAVALYAMGKLGLDDAMARLSKKLGVPVAAIQMSEAEAAIDVDKPDDLILVREIIEARQPRRLEGR